MDDRPSSFQLTSAASAFSTHPPVFYQGQGDNSTRLDDWSIQQRASSQDEGREVAVEETYIAGLTSENLFVILPTTDALSSLADKYLAPEERPSRDLSGNANGADLDALILDRRWRAAADHCRKKIHSTSSESTSIILSLWILRLHCLLRLHLVQAFNVELASLFALFPPEPTFEPPFELQVFRACAPAMINQQGRAESIENFTRLVKRCKIALWAARNRMQEVWTKRAERVGVLIADLLVELRSVISAKSLLSAYTNYAASTSVLSALCRISLANGIYQTLSSATRLLEANSDPQKPTELRRIQKLRAFEVVGQGDWSIAVNEWEGIVRDDSNDVEAINNLAICLLYSSQMQKAIDLLTEFMKSNPSLAYTCEPFLFNYSTLMELRSSDSQHIKVQLLQNVLEHGAEGVRASCLKLS